MMIVISDRQVHVEVIFAVEVSQRLVTESPTLMINNDISIIGAHQVINQFGKGCEEDQLINN